MSEREQEPIRRRQGEKAGDEPALNLEDSRPSLQLDDGLARRPAGSLDHSVGHRLADLSIIHTPPAPTLAPPTPTATLEPASQITPETAENGHEDVVEEREALAGGDRPIAVQRARGLVVIQRDGPDLPPVPDVQQTEPQLGGSGLHLHDAAPQLHLDPQVQAMIQAQSAASQLLDPAAIRAALSHLQLGSPTSLAAGPLAGPAGATSTAPPGAGAATAQPDAAPPAPHPGGAGDVMDAILAVPEVHTAITNLQTQALDRIHNDWQQLSTGGKVATVSTLTTIGLGALGGALSHPDSRAFLLSQISGKVVPVPGVSWLSVETNVDEHNLMFGVHVDVGALLPKNLGFGPSSGSPMGGPPAPPAPGSPPVQRTLAAEAAESEPDLAERIEARAGGGSELDPGARRQLEPRIGTDLSRIRIHADGEADHLARSVNAVAFTAGPNVFFRSGTYSPGSVDGLRLIAHEAVHTVQQSTGPVAGTPAPGGVTVSDPADPFEREAEQVADALVDGRAHTPSRQTTATSTAGVRVQRQAPAAPAPAPPAGQPPQTHGVPHEGVLLTADHAQVRSALEQYIVLHGWDNAYAWATRIINMTDEQKFRSQLIGVDPEDIKAVGKVMNTEIDQMQKEVTELITKFEAQAKKSTEAILDDSEKALKDQLAKLVKHDTFLGIEYGVHMEQDTEKAIKDAARELATKRRETNRLDNEHAKAHDEANKIFNANAAPSLAAALPELVLPPDLIHRLEQAREAAMHAEEDYAKLCQTKQATFPILAMFTAEKDAVERLENFAAQPQGGMANFIEMQTQEKLNNIKKVRSEMGGDKFSVWQYPHILTVAQQQLAPPLVAWQTRVCQDIPAKKNAERAADERTREMIWGTLAIGLGLIAAIPTGGLSLAGAAVVTAAAVTGAAIAIYGAYEHLEKYTLETAAEGTAFDKAEAISRDEPPSFFWLAIDIVSAIADVHAAFTAFKTLKVMIEAANAVQGAEAAEKLAEVAEAARKAGLHPEAQARVIGAAAGVGAGGGVAGVRTTLAAIRAAFKRVTDAAIWDQKLMEAFLRAADKLIAEKKVAVIAGSEAEQMAAIRELLLAHGGGKHLPEIAADARRYYNSFKNRAQIGLYVGSYDIILLRGDAAEGTVASFLAHELTHQKQNLLNKMENMSLYESEYEAFAAQQQFLLNMPVESVPPDMLWLLRSTPTDIENHVLRAYPTAFKPHGIANEQIAEDAIEMLKGGR
jgi:hypothetical protein